MSIILLAVTMGCSASYYRRHPQVPRLYVYDSAEFKPYISTQLLSQGGITKNDVGDRLYVHSADGQVATIGASANSRVHRLKNVHAWTRVWTDTDGALLAMPSKEPGIWTIGPHSVEVPVNPTGFGEAVLIDDARLNVAITRPTPDESSEGKYRIDIYDLTAPDKSLGNISVSEYPDHLFFRRGVLYLVTETHFHPHNDGSPLLFAPQPRTTIVAMEKQGGAWVATRSIDVPGHRVGDIDLDSETVLMYRYRWIGWTLMFYGANIYQWDAFTFDMSSGKRKAVPSANIGWSGRRSFFLRRDVLAASPP